MPAGPRDHRLGARDRSTFPLAGHDRPLNLYWGDLHNHNAVGYAKGSLARSIDLAREHLDFFAFTGHASWHDLPKMPGDRHQKWIDGFRMHSAHWPKTKAMIREANTDDFVAFLGYEWHSSVFGDYCMIYRDDDGDLFLPDHVDKLHEFAHDAGALAIPHHISYKQGWRGANFQHFKEHVSPVVEIFSEHGCSETDRAPFPYLRHSIGGRSTANTVEYQLKKDLRFGFVASSDDHLGYPGAYGEGVVGIWADELNRDDLFAAILARRTFAATGDRIVLEVTLNGRPMGSDMARASDRQIDVRAIGQDAIRSIELVRNGRVIERHFPEDHAEEPVRLPGIVKCRLQYGWGPWGELALDRICDWDMTVRIDGGKFVRALPCYQCSPFDENRRDRLEFLSDTELRLRSPTTRAQAYAEDPTKAVVLEIDGTADATLTVALRSPSEQTISRKLVSLADDNHVEFTGVFTSESLILNRLIGPSEYSATVRWRDRRGADDADWYYVRVTQHNGHMAWSSPIWVG
ncbi:MAG: hypothetical protein WD066_09650 [Planctomycetaceae bacterium]